MRKFKVIRKDNSWNLPVGTVLTLELTDGTQSPWFSWEGSEEPPGTTFSGLYPTHLSFLEEIT